MASQTESIEVDCKQLGPFNKFTTTTMNYGFCDTGEAELIVQIFSGWPHVSAGMNEPL